MNLEDAHMLLKLLGRRDCRRTIAQRVPAAQVVRAKGAARGDITGSLHLSLHAFQPCSPSYAVRFASCLNTTEEIYLYKFTCICLWAPGAESIVGSASESATRQPPLPCLPGAIPRREHRPHRIHGVLRLQRYRQQHGRTGY